MLILFGEGPAGPDMPRTQRRTTPAPTLVRSPSREARFTRPTRRRPRRPCARRGGDRSRPSRSRGLRHLPELWPPPSNFAVTAVLGWWKDPSRVEVVDPRGGQRGPPGADRGAARPPAPGDRPTPNGYSGPGFLIGDSKDLILWGFTAGLISTLFDHVGLTRPWDASVEVIAEYSSAPQRSTSRPPRPREGPDTHFSTGVWSC